MKNFLPISAGRAGLLAAALLSLPLAAYGDRSMSTLENVEKKLQAVPTRTRASVVALFHKMAGGLAAGSGTIVSEDGVILTAAHVVADAETVDVIFPDGKKLSGKVLGCDFDHDLAILKIVEPGKYPFVELGESGKLKVGDDVAALGHPGGFDLKRGAPVRYGRIFGVEEGKFLRSDCILVGGDSGGPLFDLDGKLIGVHSSVGEELSINNDVPVDIAKAGWDRMMKGERWGVNKESATDLSAEELAGLNIQKFRRKLTEENMKGASITDTGKLQEWMIDAGMNSERVKAMSPEDVTSFARRCRVIAGQSEANLPTIPQEELAGLDLPKFRKQVTDEAMKNNGKLASTPDAISGWLRAAGMAEEKIKSMDDAQLAAFLAMALGGAAEVKAEGSVPAIPEEELAGLDLPKFRKLVTDEAAKTHGKLTSTPEMIAGWLRAAGMAEEKVKSMKTAELFAFVGKALGETAEVKAEGSVAAPANDNVAVPEGLDLAKLRALLMEEGARTGGKIEATPDLIAGWLQKAGMEEAKAKALSPEDSSALISKAMGAAASVQKVEGGGAPAIPAGLEGVDMGKLKKLITDEAMKNNGKLAVDPAVVSGWLRECGMSEEKAKALTPRDVNAAVQAALGKTAAYKETQTAVLTPDQKIIAELDREVLTTVLPSMVKTAPSVVTFMDGAKKLAMGTIVKTDGFIVTKHSEIARAGEGKLRAVLADGRTFVATEVTSFKDHDLALVKIEADSLPALKISETASPAPGSFLFSPGCGVNSPILGIGVLSVADRALKETGGYLGVLLKELPENGGVEVGETVAGSPAGAAGLVAGDRVLSLNGSVFKTAAEVSAFVRTLKPQDTLKLVYQRGAEERSAEIVLAERPVPKKDKNGGKSMTAIGTEVSDVTDGYPLIFQHDQQLKPEDCGGPIIDLHGNVVGVNIARVGRVDSYAIPAKTVGELLGTVDFEKLKSAPAGK